LSGKTSLIRRLCGKDRPTPVERTSGIEVHSLERGDEHALLLDCGGHAVYHIFHEHFLSDAAVALVVVLSPGVGQADPTEPEKLRLLWPRDGLCPCFLAELPEPLTARTVTAGPYIAMREELRHWLTMAQARTSRLKELHKQHPALETRRPVLVVFNFEGFPSEPAGDPRLFTKEWRYRATSIREMLAPVKEEFEGSFSFLDHVLWDGERSLEDELVCVLVSLFLPSLVSFLPTIPGAVGPLREAAFGGCSTFAAAFSRGCAGC